ncbi:MAG: AmmeMemoRadiSam system protein A [Accumulibacter sp.]
MPSDPVDRLGPALLTIARNAIAHHFGLPTRPPGELPELAEPAATFVTLTRNGQLRGCIGSLEAHRPLLLDVGENALAAAFRDHRFAPLTADEFATTRVEVSLLTPPEPFPVADEADAIARLRPGVDGLVLGYRQRRATFLPQVWESLPDARQFLAQLKLKAGLPADFWHPEVTLARYGVRKWKEK